MRASYTVQTEKHTRTHAHAHIVHNVHSGAVGEERTSAHTHTKRTSFLSECPPSSMFRKVGGVTYLDLLGLLLLALLLLQLLQSCLHFRSERQNDRME